MVAYAFPSLPPTERTESDKLPTHAHGMTLKDWFAGQVIAAMIGSDPSFSSQRDKNGQHCELEKSKLANMAKNSYQVAEAMMQARATLKIE